MIGVVAAILVGQLGRVEVRGPPRLVVLIAVAVAVIAPWRPDSTYRSVDLIKTLILIRTGLFSKMCKPMPDAYRLHVWVYHVFNADK